MATYVLKLTLHNVNISRANYLNASSSQNAAILAKLISEQLLKLPLNILIVALSSNNVECTYNPSPSYCSTANIRTITGKVVDLLQIPAQYKSQESDITINIEHILQRAGNFTLKISVTFKGQVADKVVSIKKNCPAGTQELTASQIANLSGSNQSFPNLYCACKVGSMDSSDGVCKCSAGSYMNNGACDACPAGTFSNVGANVCSSCPVGKFSNIGASTCVSNTALNCATKSTTKNECLTCDISQGYGRGHYLWQATRLVDLGGVDNTQCILCLNLSSGNIHCYLSISDEKCVCVSASIPNCQRYARVGFACEKCDDTQLLMQDRYYLYNGSCYTCPSGGWNKRCQCPDGVSVYKDNWHWSGWAWENHVYNCPYGNDCPPGRKLLNKSPTDQQYWDLNCPG